MPEMKLILMAAALTLGTAAAAQTTDTEMSTTMANGGQTVAPDNSAPERDARGIAVVSAPAMAPAGYNQPAQQVPAGTAPPAPTASMGSAGPLPPCTRTVTDHCTQTYERGRSR
jgi:hypothetical protein